jgi:O-antigen ligase
MTFTTNIGTADRMIRFVLGAVLIVLTLTGTIGLWGWIGIVPLATAFVKYCPAYSIFGIRTCARE